MKGSSRTYGSHHGEMRTSEIAAYAGNRLHTSIIKKPVVKWESSGCCILGRDMSENRQQHSEVCTVACLM